MRLATLLIPWSTDSGPDNAQARHVARSLVGARAVVAEAAATVVELAVTVALTVMADFLASLAGLASAVANTLALA